MSSINPCSYSSNKANKNDKFYITSFQPISYYSSNPPQTTDRNNKESKYYIKENPKKIMMIIMIYISVICMYFIQK